ncbi:MAG: LytTR family DNA-binding domain-containing protein [Clostridiales bacterium]|nr:LytTR family DNA-binding domain-containing protein [Clostridiales bacterium]
MYHVAICDDDKVFVSYIKKILNQARENRECQFKIYEFGSGEDLVSCLDTNMHLDLLILDMELGGMDGDETARQFREKFKDAVLVFCSGVRTPTVKSFKATPYRYLLKSYSDVQFVHELKEILAEVEKKVRKEYIIGHYRNNVIKVNVHNILYVENAKRGSKVTVCSNCEEARFKGQILVDDKLGVLSQKFHELVFAHSSYIININHVEKIVGHEVYLDSGEYLSISRTYQKSFRETFTKSIAAKY